MTEVLFTSYQGFICEEHAWAALSNPPHADGVCPTCGRPGIWMPGGWWAFFVARNKPRSLDVLMWRVMPAGLLIEKGVVDKGNDFVRWCATNPLPPSVEVPYGEQPVS